ncbi:bacteriocin immunity protein [Enterococcus sp. DIV0800]|uniref:bacteriocin immunity protein n=1 Tax=unclassified Enterococcus TaxID=2608891 RepID=UPI003D2FFD03
MADKETEILNDVERLLKGNLSKQERLILEEAQNQFESKVYFPKIIKDLEISLTPLAIQSKLSKEVGAFYLKITSHRFINKGFGPGLIIVGGMNS